MVFKKREMSYGFILLIIHLCMKLCIGSGINRETIRESSNEFDVLIFTQRWPITDCMTWMNRGNDHACALPSQKDTWTIHGVWPTKFGTIGPLFCNKSAPFDINALEPLEDQLRQYWINIEKGTPEASLWEHEWLKHGTCAMLIEDLNSENKYFGQGLAWLQQYTMNGLLSKANIEPGSQFHVTELHDAIKSTLNTNPSIHCVREKNHKGEQYLSEIKICFNKQLELVNCDGVKLDQRTYVNDAVITNCDANMPINYPSKLPQYLLDNANTEPKPVWRFPWVNLYKLIQIIKWFTL